MFRKYILLVALPVIVLVGNIRFYKHRKHQPGRLTASVDTVNVGNVIRSSAFPCRNDICLAVYRPGGTTIMDRYGNKLGFIPGVNIMGWAFLPSSPALPKLYIFQKIASCSTHKKDTSSDQLKEYNFYVFDMRSSRPRFKKLNLHIPDEVREFLSGNLEYKFFVDTVLVAVNKITSTFPKRKELGLIIPSGNKVKLYKTDFTGAVISFHRIGPNMFYAVTRANLNGIIAPHSGLSDDAAGVYIYTVQDDSIFMLSRYISPFETYSYNFFIPRDTVAFLYTSTYEHYAGVEKSQLILLSFPELHEISHINYDFSGIIPWEIMHSRKGDVVPVFNPDRKELHFVSVDSFTEVARVHLNHYPAVSPDLSFMHARSSLYPDDFDGDGYDELILFDSRVLFSDDPRWGFHVDNKGNTIGQAYLFVLDDDLKTELSSISWHDAIIAHFYRRYIHTMVLTRADNFDQEFIFVRFTSDE